MKRIFGILLFSMLLAFPALSQGRYTFLELDYGLNVASIHPCRVQHDWIVNQYARLLFKREWKEQIYIMSGIAYQPKGTRKRFFFEPQPGQEAVGSATLRLEHFTIPFILELEFNLGDSDLKLYLNGGGFYSFLIRDEWEIKMEETVKEKTNIDVNSDSGLLLGTGLGYLAGDRWEIIARLNIEYGLKFWNARHPWADIQNVKSRNFPITIGAAYLLSD